MTVHRVPYTEDLAGWLRANAAPGDVVHLEPRVYRVPSVSLKDQHGVTLLGHGATIMATTDPAKATSWSACRPLELIACTGWRIDNLRVRGTRPDGAGYDRAREGQHGVSLLGGSDNHLHGVTAYGLWGDGFYLARYGDGPDRNPTGTVICGCRTWQVSRHAIAVTAATETLLYDFGYQAIQRTGLNMEAHEGQEIRAFAAYNLSCGYSRLMLATSTGPGAAVDVSFENVAVDASKVFNPVVSGQAGKRARWSFRNVYGAKQPTSTKEWGRLTYVDGLTLVDCPKTIYTTGSRMTPETS